MEWCFVFSSDLFLRVVFSPLRSVLCMSFRYASRNLSSPIKANLHFSLSRSGTFALDRADAVIEITEWVEVPRKNLTVDNSTMSTANISLETGAKNASEESSEKSQMNDDNVNASDSNTNDNNVADLGMEKKLKRRTFRVPLKVLKVVPNFHRTLFSFL